MKWYIYNLAVLVPNKENKQLEIQDAQIKCENKLTQKDIDKISEIKKGNVLATYLGIFNERQEENYEILAANYMTVEDVQQIKKDWSEAINE